MVLNVFLNLISQLIKIIIDRLINCEKKSLVAALLFLHTEQYLVSEGKPGRKKLQISYTRLEAIYDAIKNFWSITVFFFFLNCLPERETEKGCSCAQTELNISDAVATVLNLSFHLFWWKEMKLILSREHDGMVLYFTHFFTNNPIQHSSPPEIVKAAHQNNV